MKKTAMTLMGLSALAFAACNNNSSTQQEAPETDSMSIQPVNPEQSTVEENAENLEIKVTGKVTAIENGKDGYMATIEDETGASFVATISIVNLQRSSGEFKRLEVGDSTTVSGESWIDDTGINHIKATAVE